MNIFFVLVILPVVTNCGPTETSKEPSKDSRPRTTIKPLPKDAATSEVSTTHNSESNSMWFYPPMHERQAVDMSRVRQVMSKPPRTLTRLAKTFYTDFRPSFSLDYFEPFERRSKPVTLITFRRNGIAKQQTIKVLKANSAEVAELQSPYNDISSFWRDESEETLKK